MHEKRELRGSLRARLAGLADDERSRRSAHAVRNLLHIPELRRPRAVALYAATSDEADPGSARSTLERRGARIALPRVRADGDLELVGTDGELVAGFRGIPEPRGEALPLEGFDVIVVPGVAFDRDGGRLGRGGGHYDRLLDALRRDVTTVGFAFAFQVVDHVPVLDHDRPVDIVVTDEGVHRSDG